MNRFFAALLAHEKGDSSGFVPFFRDASLPEALLALHLLAGREPPLRRSLREIEALVRREAALPDWLVDRCKQEGSDLPEILARLWPRSGRGLAPSLPELFDAAAGDLSALLDQATAPEQIYLLRLLSNKLHLHIPLPNLAEILATAFACDPRLLETRLAEGLPESPAELEALLHPPAGTDPAQWHPLPFAHPRLFAGTDPAAHLTLEWKWDGLRAQLLRRGDKTLLWSEREGLVSQRYPTLIAEAAALPEGCVLDGILLPWRDENPLPAYFLNDTAVPVIYMAWDCLEVHGVDIRAMPLYARRMQLLPMFGNHDFPSFRCSEELRFRDEEQARSLHAQARGRGARGLVLKPADSPYRDGCWDVWPAEIQRMRAMLLYSVLGDAPEYAFGLRRGQEWVAVARIRDEIPEEIRILLENYVRHHTLDKKGPVRGLAPGLVCELGYEERRPSQRHKIGWVLEGLRILRHLPAAEADSFF